MNRELLKQMGQAAIDFANGESIQYQYLTKWIDVDEDHCFYPDKQYRIKPKPRIIWVNEYDGSSPCVGHDTEEEAELFARRPIRQAIPYRELTPEEREELKI
jgi:hypothetical protein